jgi:hypothetical protein
VAFLTMAAAIGQAKAAVILAPPPPPPHGAIYHRAPRHGMVWTPGYYRWRGSAYYWMPGAWAVPPHPGAVWVAPAWRHRHGGYVFVAGRWR